MLCCAVLSQGMAVFRIRSQIKVFKGTLVCSFGGYVVELLGKADGVRGCSPWELEKANM